MRWLLDLPKVILSEKELGLGQSFGEERTRNDSDHLSKEVKFESRYNSRVINLKYALRVGIVRIVILVDDAINFNG